MFERAAIKIASAGSAAALALGALQGCGLNNETYQDQPTIPRCYDDAQPSEYVPPAEPEMPKRPALPKDNSLKALTKYEQRYQRFNKNMRNYVDASSDYYLPPLRLAYQDGYVVGDPVYPKEVYDATTDAVVMLEVERSKGSGFLAETPAGKQVVVTAAHVVETATMDNITITTDEGTETRATGGCYVYERGGNLVTLDHDNNKNVEADLDLAVLTLEDTLPNPALKISNASARRGAWVALVNYQADHAPSFPANYTGLVTSTPRDKLGYTLLTGMRTLETPVLQSAINDEIMQGGASGGPAVNVATGEVVGVTTSTQPTGETTKDVMDMLYGVKVPGAPFGIDGGFIPSSGTMMSPKLIRAALNSSALNQ